MLIGLAALLLAAGGGWLLVVAAPGIAGFVSVRVSGCPDAVQLKLLASPESVQTARTPADDFELHTAEGSYQCPRARIHVFAASLDDSADSGEMATVAMYASAGGDLGQIDDLYLRPHPAGPRHRWAAPAPPRERSGRREPAAHPAGEPDLQRPVAYRTLETGEPGTPPVQFKAARLPGPSVLGGQNLAISAHTDQPYAAQELIEFLTGARSQQILFERGGFAATRDKGVRAALNNGGKWPPGFAERLTDALDGIRRP